MKIETHGQVLRYFIYIVCIFTIFVTVKTEKIVNYLCGRKKKAERKDRLSHSRKNRVLKFGYFFIRSTYSNVLNTFNLEVDKKFE